jgi:hypothetical protein
MRSVPLVRRVWWACQACSADAFKLREGETASSSAGSECPSLSAQNRSRPVVTVAAAIRSLVAPTWPQQSPSLEGIRPGLSIGGRAVALVVRRASVPES